MSQCYRVLLCEPIDFHAISGNEEFPSLMAPRKTCMPPFMLKGIVSNLLLEDIKYILPLYHSLGLTGELGVPYTRNRQ